MKLDGVKYIRKLAVTRAFVTVPLTLLALFLALVRSLDPAVALPQIRSTSPQKQVHTVEGQVSHELG